jgi:predicted N-formylglutamate amidohydrolase
MPDPSFSAACETSPAFDPVLHIEGARDAGVLFLCDHASNALPPEYGDLGLPAFEFQRHIAYDIGAAHMTRALARSFGAPAVLTTFSRLLIDPNRGGDDPTLVMRISDGALIPGNARVDAMEIERRRRRFWQPYRDAVTGVLDDMLAAGPVPAIVSLHSFTPAWRSVPRPWHVGVLWDLDRRLAQPFIAAFGASGDCLVGDNEPYDGALEGDTMDTHSTRRGLAGILIEVRQDLIAREPDAVDWAERLERVLRPVLAQPDAHMIRHYGSRAYASCPAGGPHP